jgi:hypothetical protein
MTSPLVSTGTASLGELLRRRLRELGRTPEDLAEAVQVPAHYIADLMAGTRRPPLPARTDIYPKMTSFLRLGRNVIIACADAERAGTASSKRSGPGIRVRTQLLALCEPGTARALERRARRGNAELVGFFQRVLDVTQGAVRRALDDQIALRLAAAERGRTYVAIRFAMLEFLDATAGTLTVQHLSDYLRPRVARWDVDLDTGVLRVVLRAGPRDRTPKREPDETRHDD